MSTSDLRMVHGLEYDSYVSRQQQDEDQSDPISSGSFDEDELLEVFLNEFVCKKGTYENTFRFLKSIKSQSTVFSEANDAFQSSMLKALSTLLRGNVNQENDREGIILSFFGLIKEFYETSEANCIQSRSRLVSFMEKAFQVIVTQNVDSLKGILQGTYDPNYKWVFEHAVRAAKQFVSKAQDECKSFFFREVNDFICDELFGAYSEALAGKRDYDGKEFLFFLTELLLAPGLPKGVVVEAVDKIIKLSTPGDDNGFQDFLFSGLIFNCCDETSEDIKSCSSKYQNDPEALKKMEKLMEVFYPIFLRCEHKRSCLMTLADAVSRSEILFVERDNFTKLMNLSEGEKFISTLESKYKRHVC